MAIHSNISKTALNIQGFKCFLLLGRSCFLTVKLYIATAAISLFCFYKICSFNILQSIRSLLLSNHPKYSSQEALRKADLICNIFCLIFQAWLIYEYLFFLRKHGIILPYSGCRFCLCRHVAVSQRWVRHLRLKITRIPHFSASLLVIFVCNCFESQSSA